MTKIKNTKKGMAKKTLSISLAVAMLATSNVPVWAAEFTDGTDAAFTSEAVVETPVEEVVTDAPVVEEELADAAEAEPSDSLVYDDTELAKFKMPEWDVATEDFKLPAICYKDDGKATDGFINAYWMYNGKQIIGSATSSAANNSKELAKAMNQIAKSLMDNAELTKERCIEGGNFSLDIKINANGGINFHRVYDFGALQAVDLTKHLEECVKDGWLGGFRSTNRSLVFDNVTYNGKEQKPEPKQSEYAEKQLKEEGAILDNKNSEKVLATDKYLYINDFSYDYVRDVNGKKDITSADHRVGESSPDVLLQVAKPGYTGSVAINDAYQIVRKDLTQHEGDLSITVPKKDYEFTGADIVPAKNEVVFKDTETGDDLSAFIDRVKLGETDSDKDGDNNGWVGNDKDISVYFDIDNEDKTSLIQNYKVGNKNDSNHGFVKMSAFNVVKRDLTKCTVEVLGDFTKGEMDDRIDRNKGFTWGTEVVLKDAEGNVLGGEFEKNGKFTKSGVLYDLLKNTISKADGNYYVTVKPSGTSSNHKAETQISGELESPLATPNASLRECKVYFEAAKQGQKDEADREFSKFLKDTVGDVEYTGEAYKVTKDDIYVRDYATSKNRRLTEDLYEIECDPTYGVGRHWVKIHGKGDYAGSTLTVWYNVIPAHYEDHSVESKVVFNESYSKASDYAEAIGLKIIAENNAEEEHENTLKTDKTDVKTFELTKDDYTVEYKYNDYDKNENGNYLHNTITVTATITNPNYLDTANVNHKNVKVENGKVVISETVEIVHPSIADAKVEVIGDYTFTGKKIIPEVKVTAADGTILKENEDYRLEVLNSEHASTDGKKAQVVITAIKKCKSPEDPAKAHYEYGTKNNKTFFEIAPADITKIVAKEFTYTGEAQTPTRDELVLTLNTVSMDRFFKETMPKYFENNVNAGTATVELFVKDEYAHDFTAPTVKMPFTINPFAIQKTEFYAKNPKSTFTVYGANGHIIDFRAFEGFAYDGTAKTFKDADFTYEIQNNASFMNGAKYELKKGKDYTIEYADNIYPDKTGKNGKTSYVYTKLSPNFIILDGDKVSDDAAITTQDGTVITNVAAQEKFFITKASVEKANVSVENPVYNFGDKVEPKVTVTVDGKTLVEGTDYELVYDKDETYDATAENSKTVTVKGLNGYVGSTKVVNWGIDKKDLNSEDVTVTLDKKSYKPNEEPEVLAVVIGKNVVDASEYTVAYTDKEKGILTITGAGKNFTGDKVVEYTVAARADLADAKVEGCEASYTVTGEAIRPEITVIVGNKYLTEGEDYTVTYGENTEIGTGTITITAVEGNPDYKGSQTIKFEIVDGRADLAEASIKGYADSYQYTGEAIEPEVRVVLNGKILEAGVDYELEYKDNVEVGTATITAKALEGSYEFKNEATATFEIVDNRADLAGATVYGIKDSYEVTGEEIIVEDLAVVLDNKFLTEGEDYTVAYSNNVEIGTATVTITAVEGSDYVGSIEKTFEITEVKPLVEKTMIDRVEVVGNKATVILTGNVDGATGYDYVISTDKDCITNKDYDKVNKNVLNTETAFQYVDKGTYYAYCHAWTRDENGTKVFGEWSDAEEFTIESTTPSQPVITNVSVKGSTVTVTYTKAADALGYDVVLGTEVATVYREKRPVKYGELVKKNINGDKVTATFKNVPEGTYYAGLHAFNRTPDGGKKVFSPWSNIKKVVVK